MLCHSCGRDNISSAKYFGYCGKLITSPSGDNQNGDSDKKEGPTVPD